MDDTSEITIVTGVQESDLGGGAQIQVITPRGTSEYHGALHAYNRNSAFAANNFFSNKEGTPISYRNRNQFGGKIGGPIPIPRVGEGGKYLWRDKVFGFFAYDGIRDPNSVRYTRTILTPTARNGEFRFPRATAGDPINSGGISCPTGAAGSQCTITNILQFAQNVGFQGIPSAINPISQSRLLDPMPAQGNFTGGDGLNSTGYAFNRGFNQVMDTYTARIDIDPTQKDGISFVYSWNLDDFLRPDVDITGYSPSPDVTQYSENMQYSIAYRRSITSNFVNEFRFGRFTNEVPFARVSPYPEFSIHGAGVATVTSTALLGGLMTNPENVFLDQGRNNAVTTFADNATLILGRHTLRFGGIYQKYEVDSYNDVAIRPVYRLGNTNVSPETSTLFTQNHFANVGGAGSIIDSAFLGRANGLLAIMAGLVNLSQVGFNMQDINTGYARGTRQLGPYRNWNHALYVTDRWQIRPGLTLNFGVRWEMFPALRIDNGLALEVLIDDPKNPLASLMSGNGRYGVVGTNAGKEYRYYKTDWNNFGPSVGIAWTPNFSSGIAGKLLGREGKSVIRAGYNQSYANDQIITALVNSISGNIGLGRQIISAIGPAGNTQLNLRLGQTVEIPLPAAPDPNRTFLQNNTAGQGFFGLAGAIDPNLQVPMVRSYSFGIQRELPWDMVVEARYVGTSSNNLLRNSNFNEIDVVGNGFLADFRRAQANLALTGTTAFCDPGTVAGCQALTLFRSGAIGTGPLVVGTSLPAGTFNTQLRNGAVADLAHSFVTLNLNNHPTLADPNRTPFVKFYPNPNTGTINLMLNDARYNYNSLQLELRRRFTHGLLMGANYTFSKNLTNGQGIAQNVNETYLQRDNKGLDYQRADSDITHIFNLNALYQLPFGRGKAFWNTGRALNLLVGGWELSGIAQIRSGQPISFVDARGTLNRSAFSGLQTANSTLSPAQIRSLMGVFEQDGNFYWINPSIIRSTGQASQGYIHPSNQNTAFDGQVFFNLDPGSTSGLPRAIVDGPGFWNVNMALMKNFNFTETLKVQLRMEAFNVFNNVNFQNNAQYAGINSTTFGRITSAAAPRIMQFAFRFEF